MKAKTTLFFLFGLFIFNSIPVNGKAILAETFLNREAELQVKKDLKLPSFEEKGDSVESVKVKFASLSYIPVKWNKSANLITIEKMVKEAAAAGAQVVITPEGGLEGYLIDELLGSKEREKWEPKFQEIAESIDGPCMMKIRALARETGVDLIIGFLERDGEILYNSCAWIGSDGEVVHLHRKTHLMEPYFDPENYHPGFELKAFDTRYGRMGIMICYERQVPEVAGALALDGARVLINPSYGSRGEWNNTTLRTRARDNNAYLVFTHPKQSLFIAPDGQVIADVDNERGAGIVYAELNITEKQNGKFVRRRTEVFSDKLAENISQGNQRLSKPGFLKVAAVQMRSTHKLKENVEQICKYLSECAKNGVRVAVFPECVTTGYFKNEIPNYSGQDLLEAEKTIADACKENKIYAVFGSPYPEEGSLYNMALVIDADGKTIYRQAKIYLVGGDKPWAKEGKKLGTFRVDGEICSIIICHDSRFPELVRLPVLKGSRLVFYISWESGFREEHKIEPYRAQVVARAVENNVFIVHANAPQSLEPVEGSHGQSRIVGPDGTLIREASVLGEDVLIELLDLNKATGKTAMESLQTDFLQEWWEAGLEKVVEP